jgi:hypothetical protein
MNRLKNISKKRVAVILVSSLLVEFLIAWFGFVYLPVLGLITVVAGWITMAYGVYLLVRQPKII